MRRPTIFLFILSLLGGGVLFKVKYAVIEVENQLEQIVQQIKREKENIHILKAEWSHLNEPQRLQKLAEKFLEIMPMKTEQIVAIRNNYEGEKKFKSIFPYTQLASMKGDK